MLSPVGRENRKQCIHQPRVWKPCGPTQAGPLAQYLAWLIQTYDGMGGRIPEKHKRQQAFDNAWKEIPPYTGFSVLNQAYRKITQWQGKELCNLGHCISTILVSALRNPDSSQYHNFTSTLKCVSALVDFTLMAQYPSHTPDILSYMASYPQRCHWTKDIFLEFHTSKATRAQANRQDREVRDLMADQRTKDVHYRWVTSCRLLADQERVERSDRQADLIRRENHFNFIIMHYLTDFAFHRGRFGSISMHPT